MNKRIAGKSDSDKVADALTDTDKDIVHDPDAPKIVSAGDDAELPEDAKTPSEHAETMDFTEVDSQPLDRPPKKRKVPADENAPTMDFTHPEHPPRKALRKSAAPKSTQGKRPASKSNILGDYQLMKKLGAGGMGAVFKARQISLDREVAVKVLPKHLAEMPNLVQRFMREARVMAKLDHPNILHCYGAGEARGLHYLAMEFVDGGSLQAYLDEYGQFDVGDALYIFLECAQGLQHAHDNNMIHRDIKPENILLTKSGRVKVADLGLAKALDDDMVLTQTGTGAGTPLYMPPEQARNVKHIDQRSDIYSLGCVLYRMLTGEVPFKGDTVVEVIAAKDSGKFTSARHYNEEIPSRLNLIIEKMLMVKPDHRFQSCQEIIDELEALDLSYSCLSFLDTAEPLAKSARPAAKKMAPTKPTPSLSETAIVRGGIPGGEEPQADIWYIELETADGQKLKRKVHQDKLIGLIKNNAIDNKTRASRTFGGKYLPLGTYSAFSSLFAAKMTQEKADRKGDKFRELYQKIEKAENRRQFKQKIHNLFLRTGGFVGFLCVIVIIIALLGGVWYLFRDTFSEWARQIGMR